MAPGVKTLSSSAIQSHQDLHVHSPTGSSVIFRDIVCSSPGAALDSERSIFLEGNGRILFENLCSFKGGAAARADNDVIKSTVATLVVRNTFGANRGGAFYAGLGIYLDSNGTVMFENCTSSWRGGALSSRGHLRIGGNAEYIFRNCSSAGKVIGGGALSAIGSVLVELQSGSVSFRQCRAPAMARGGSGGAISSNGDINISSGRVDFEACWAGTGNGNAMMAPNGFVSLSSESHVSLVGMEGFSGSAIFARRVFLPVGGSVLPAQVYSLLPLLASKLNSQGDEICPAGSRFSVSSRGLPDRSKYGKCRICDVGTASLTPASVEIQNVFSGPELGMRVVLVRRGSPNAIKSFQDLAAGKASRFSGLGLERGDWDPNMEAPLVKLGKENILKFKFHDGKFRTPDGWLLAVPFGLFYPDAPLGLVKEGEVPWKREINKVVLFRMDRFKDEDTMGPLHARGLVLGFGRDVTAVYQPPNPYKACVPCHLLAREGADKIQCHGGTHVSSLPGYMLFHRQGGRRLEVHVCPNAAACPGSNLSLTADGQITSASRLCSKGYDDRSSGCVRCSPGHGRQQLDPFTCQKCGTSALGGMAKAFISNGIFYAWALRSARPRTETRQIFTIFLAFLTISFRSLAAYPHTRHFQRLKGDVYAVGRMLRKAFVAADTVTTVEPGFGIDSFDCWVGAPVGVYRGLCLSWSIPLALLLVSLAWHKGRHGQRSLVVWGNVFAPRLFGASAMLAPCVSTQESRGRILMYEAVFDTPCASSVMDAVRIPRLWLSLMTSILLLLLVPVLWLSLVTKGSAYESETVGFLVGGYRSTHRWWEVWSF